MTVDLDEDDPHVSSGGLMLFYTSNAAKKLDVMLSRRKSTSDAWPGAHFSRRSVACMESLPQI